MNFSSCLRRQRSSTSTSNHAARNPLVFVWIILSAIYALLYLCQIVCQLCIQRRQVGVMDAPFFFGLVRVVCTFDRRRKTLSSRVTSLTSSAYVGDKSLSMLRHTKTNFTNERWNKRRWISWVKQRNIKTSASFGRQWKEKRSRTRRDIERLASHWNFASGGRMGRPFQCRSPTSVASLNEPGRW